MSLEQLSLFSVVQFPNDDCTSSSSSTTTGTCYTSSECSSRSGSSDGSCAAGFGVCCVISTSTCGATVSSNNTYIRNPGYPSSYTPTSTGSCTVTVKKMSADICQLRKGLKIGIYNNMYIFFFFLIFWTFLSDLIFNQCLLRMQQLQELAVTTLRPRETLDKILQESAELTQAITVRLCVKKN